MTRAFLDVDTQIDFLFPSGALYANGMEDVIPVIAKLNRFAMNSGLPLISTECAHGEQDPEFERWGPHCVLGTVGQQKPAVLRVGQQIFQKQHTDLFQAPDAEMVIAQSGADEWVVYGVVTEVCVQQAAFGLLERGKRVVVVADAVKEVDADSAAAFWAELTQRGGAVVTSEEILAGK